MAGAGTYAGAWWANRANESSFVEELEELDRGSGFRMAASADSAEGKLSSLAKAYGGNREKARALKKGYIRWHVVGSNFSEPRYVNPEQEGSGIPELEYNGQTYLFPPDATVPAQEEGVPVMIHRKGEAEPINLEDSWNEAIDAGSLKQYLTERVTSEAPEETGGGMLGSLADMDSMAILRYGIIAMVVVFVALEVLG